MNRRSFLILGAKTAAGLVLAQAVPAWASVPAPSADKSTRHLAFYHTHTGKHLEITYARNGVYDAKALQQVNQYLRDFRTNEVHPIDTELLDMLWNIQQELGCESTYEVISGYRSPQTNQNLRHRSNGVARLSLHMKGQALDVRLTGQKTSLLRDSAIALQSGGVGYYPKSNFIHLDTGRVRNW
jgi:uncharacterized protein YcbK (DUF882 family)